MADTPCPGGAPCSWRLPVLISSGAARRECDGAALFKPGRALFSFVARTKVAPARLKEMPQQGACDPAGASFKVWAR